MEVVDVVPVAVVGAALDTRVIVVASTVVALVDDEVEVDSVGSAAGVMLSRTSSTFTWAPPACIRMSERGATTLPLATAGTNAVRVTSAKKPAAGGSAPVIATAANVALPNWRLTLSAPGLPLRSARRPSASCSCSVSPSCAV